jgi:hypothetical protein
VFFLGEAMSLIESLLGGIDMSEKKNDIHITENHIHITIEQMSLNLDQEMLKRFVVATAGDKETTVQNEDTK